MNEDEEAVAKANDKLLDLKVLALVKLREMAYSDDPKSRGLARNEIRKRGLEELLDQDEGLS